MKIFLLVIFLFFSHNCFAATIQQIIPDGMGGFSTFNPETGNMISIIPDGSGGFDIYNPETGNMKNMIPDGNGGYAIIE